MAWLPCGEAKVYKVSGLDILIPKLQTIDGRFIISNFADWNHNERAGSSFKSNRIKIANSGISYS